MTQAGTAPAQLKPLVMKPLYSVETARKKFQSRYLERADARQSLTKSTHIVTPEGETQNSLPERRVVACGRVESMGDATAVPLQAC